MRENCSEICVVGLRMLLHKNTLCSGRVGLEGKSGKIARSPNITLLLTVGIS